MPIPRDSSCDTPFTTEASPGSRGAGRCPGLRLRLPWAGSPRHCCRADPGGFFDCAGRADLSIDLDREDDGRGIAEALGRLYPGGSGIEGLRQILFGGERLPRGRSAGSPKAWVPRPPSRFIRPLRVPAWRRQAEHARIPLVCAQESGQWPGEGSPDIPRASCPAHWRQALQRSRRHTMGRLARRSP